MTSASGCTKGKKKPKLKGHDPSFACKRCGWAARKKSALCKPKQL